MINFRMLKLSDLLIWGAVAFLIAVGLLAIFSATYRLQIKVDGDPFIFVKRQFFSVLIGVVLMWLFAYVDYERLKKWSPLIYLGSLGLLFMILFTGSSAMGAQRWLQIGFFSFQPSEFSKLAIILILAYYLSANRDLNTWQGLTSVGLIVLAPIILIFKQPDLGTAIVFFAILLGMLVEGEVSPWTLAFLLTPLLSLLLRPIFPLWVVYLGLVYLGLFLSRANFWQWLIIFGSNLMIGLAMPMMWGALKPYQQMRIISFLNPAADPLGAGYHTLQSCIAVGGGGFLGKGFLHGSQTQLQFIPEQHSDFIFSSIGEEFGFIGSFFVLIAYALLVWRAVSIALEARDLFGRMIAMGIAIMFAFHFFANIGMVIGILPVVGIPLPFVSFGGSSLIVNLICVGILQSIAMRRQKLIF
ncbi:rod shape-determining protein RodA [candidate division WOR-1 bacterium RIFOXYA12_FULL_52_29]|uniref:Peptidoglycan glycosyltransferase RodA n=1 Tax=candidate division WOR-1 bacterium RIFOXYC12_FULL_54_18 TaxID=1802584 RepID=A0A1F4T6E2_UNCSA|nr:MAG: rod shape-determining protein RodA [candidate division WOR-1 bacterium RIFOXYA2_FULL_51_19]OGC17226.1 MAG: rod shape-determining protein RodA [candidate division WOR-1 bacterium RIFOXYA12_FULL_52_29]OGC26086.1 MAG: rod shape-determining protein RodA [candidate division WOR-1 bacterium RIFOXYB2_FULL_45_9]OGC27643.1 MAG: rod shape-determining protein RodA [candidate division WOR-1 bacterium RIFOXYC12_FULL_54_18]OGC29143.1 MAG: rod shape-determining protein RodA [candidate division WOR-1 b